MRIQTSDNAPSTELPITTLGITVDNAAPYRTYMLHCYQCGKTQLRIQGKITRVIPWLEPTSDPVVVDGCRRCGWAFTLQTTTTPTKQILFRLPQRLYTLFCLICGHDIPMLSTSKGKHECEHCHTPYDFHVTE